MNRRSAWSHLKPCRPPERCALVVLMLLGSAGCASTGSRDSAPPAGDWTPTAYVVSSDEPQVELKVATEAEPAERRRLLRPRVRRTNTAPPLKPAPVAAAEVPFELPPLPDATIAPAPPSPSPAPSATPLADAIQAGPRVTVDPGVEQVDCTTCGGVGHLGSVEGPSCATCGGSGRCVPGLGDCDAPYLGDHFVGRFFSNLYECLCCPDPCYKPTWVPAANASLFTDYARPRTVQRFRWDHVDGMQFPDRSEYFWAQQKTFFAQGAKGPGSPPNKLFNKRHRLTQPITNTLGIPALDYNQFSIYQEAAAGRSAFFTELTYREWHAVEARQASGFGDMNLGTKSLLLDCELIQFTFQFRTFLPTGNAGKGLGTGHTALEPSLIMALRLAPSTYLQAQLAQWIPLGGTPNFSGSLMHYHASLNQVLFYCTPRTPLIGMVEFNGWSFQAGSYTDPDTWRTGTFQKSSGETYCSLGPGLRLSVCDGIDFGTAVVWPITSGRWADPWLRAEIRILY